MTEPQPHRVASCHSDGTGAVAPAGAPVVALVGAPNVGKSTLFNALTGARRSVGNWPGTSVEVGRGAWKGRRVMDLVDLPGAYSLDAAHLARSLYLVSQLRELPLRLVVALTMDDVARRRGITVDAEALGRELAVPVVVVDPRRRAGLGRLHDEVLAQLDAPIPAARRVPAGLGEFELADDRFSWIEAAVARATTEASKPGQSWSDRIDRVALHVVWGPLLFLATMWAVFQLTTTVAVPLQDALDTFVAGPMSDLTLAALQGLGAGRVVTGLVVDGVIAGVGMVLTFVPLMAIMFVLLALLEDSGYLARAAVVSDRVMRLIGLPGKAFLPLIVGFGCNVPAIAATRVLATRRQRVLTALLVPFTSCSARLTVFVLLGAVFFPQRAGTVVFAMYLISILLIVLTGLLLKKTLWRAMGADPLIMDLPPYQRPTLSLVGISTWIRLKGFLQTATGIILATVVVVWALQAWPVRGEGEFADVPVRDSAYAALAETVAPVFAPAGFGSWESSGALVTGFVAKETIISTWAQTYAVADPEAGGDGAELGVALRRSFDDSSHGHPLPAVWAFMVFLLAYTPCVATLAAQWREIGARWTAFGVALQLSVAWVLAVAVFQVGRLFW